MRTQSCAARCRKLRTRRSGKRGPKRRRMSTLVSEVVAVVIGEAVTEAELAMAKVRLGPALLATHRGKRGPKRRRMSTLVSEVVAVVIGEAVTEAELAMAKVRLGPALLATTTTAQSRLRMARCESSRPCRSAPSPHRRRSPPIPGSASPRSRRWPRRRWRRSTARRPR